MELNPYKIGEAVIKIGGLEVAIPQSMCMTYIMIADCERLKLSTPDVTEEVYLKDRGNRGPLE